MSKVKEENRKKAFRRRGPKDLFETRHTSIAIPLHIHFCLRDEAEAKQVSINRLMYEILRDRYVSKTIE